jgi:hypothetical protein
MDSILAISDLAADSRRLRTRILRDYVCAALGLLNGMIHATTNFALAAPLDCQIQRLGLGFGNPSQADVEIPSS